MTFYCPQCGEDAEVISEGYCEECCYQRQLAVDCHNARMKWWDSLSEPEKTDQIKRGAL